MSSRRLAHRLLHTLGSSNKRSRSSATLFEATRLRENVFGRMSASTLPIGRTWREESIFSDASQVLSGRTSPIFSRGFATSKTAIDSDVKHDSLKVLDNVEDETGQDAYSIGEAYFYGLGVPKDLEESFYWMQKGARADDPKAQYALALLYAMTDEIADFKKSQGAESGTAADDPRKARKAVLREVNEIRRRARNEKRRKLKEERAQREKREKASQEAESKSGTAAIQITHTKSTDEEIRRCLEPTFDVTNYTQRFLRSSDLDEELEASKMKSILWLRLAASHRFTKACVRLGNLCLEEDSLTKSAAHWYTVAAEDNDADALYNLAQIYYYGNGVETDRFRAFGYFEAAAKVGDPSAQFWLGHVYRVGDAETEIEPNVNKSLQLLEQAGEQGHTGALVYLAQLFRSGDPDIGIKKDDEKFRFYLDKALQLEDAEANYILGDMYFHGSDGVAQDLTQAVKKYSRAADQEHGDALCCLGACYYNGFGVRQDFERAFHYYQRSADQGNRVAWQNVADMYLHGRGVPQDLNLANSIFNYLKSEEL